MKVIRVQSIRQVLGFSNIGWVVEDSHGDLIITPRCKVVDVPLNKVYFMKSDGRVEFRRNDRTREILGEELRRITNLAEIKARSSQYESSLLPDIPEIRFKEPPKERLMQSGV